MKVFQHNTAGGLFSRVEDALSKNPDNPDDNLFSILDQLDKFRSSDGKFRLKLCYPELKMCNEWIQTSNPAKESIITGFEALDLAFKKDSYDKEWKGLGRNKASNLPTLIDDAPNQSNWHCAIGAIVYWPKDKRIPGPKIPGAGVSIVTLYVKKI